MHLGALLQAGAINKWSVFLRKDHLETLDRLELSSTGRKGGVVTGAIWWRQKFRELCSEVNALQGYLSTCPPIPLPTDITQNLLRARLCSAEHTQVEKLQGCCRGLVWRTAHKHTIPYRRRGLMAACGSRGKGGNSPDRGSQGRLPEDSTSECSRQYIQQVFAE